MDGQVFRVSSLEGGPEGTIIVYLRKPNKDEPTTHLSDFQSYV